MSQLSGEQLTIHAGGKSVVGGASFAIESGLPAARLPSGGGQAPGHAAQAGKVHVLMGPNGSGKSSLLNALMGHPKYEITEGRITLDGEDITKLPTEKKAQKGIFLSLQHLPEISGVTLTNFLHRAYRAQKGGEIAPLEFYKHMEARAQEFGIDASFLKKHLNAGLSGGEKKQSEVLQLLALEPKFALLDEIDSGVDIDALKKVFAVIEHMKKQGVGFLLVTHYTKLLEHITPDNVSVMKEGKIVASGGRELAERIAKEGFEKIAS